MVMASLGTLMFLGVVALVFVSSRVMDVGQAYTGLSGGNIGVIEVTGPIFTSKDVIKDIRAFREDEDIKAIVVRIDSPGGGVGPAQEIYRELMKTRRDKQVVASMGSVAASGGYYIASAAQGIVANPGTITGSIGVIMEYANLQEVAKKIGISAVVIKSGEYKDIGSPLRELKDKEKKLLQGLVNELHLQFVADAAKARNIKVDEMKKMADGRIFTGQTALKLKLIDRLGNLDDSIQWAGELAGLDEDPVPVYPREDHMSILRELAETLFKNVNISGTITDNLRYVIN